MADTKHSPSNPFFSSTIPPCYRAALERLFFFNSEQHLFLNEIKVALKIFGPPRISESSHALTVVLEKYLDAQNLFCVDVDSEELLAAAIYFRSEFSELEIFHIAVSKRPETPRNGLAVFLDCVRVLKGVARQINGVRWLTMPYGRGRLKIRS